MAVENSNRDTTSKCCLDEDTRHGRGTDGAKKPRPKKGSGPNLFPGYEKYASTSNNPLGIDFALRVNAKFFLPHGTFLRKSSCEAFDGIRRGGAPRKKLFLATLEQHSFTSPHARSDL